MDSEIIEKPTILVVENDRIQRDLILLALRRIDCEVITLQNGSKVLETINTQHPALVILDLFLPQVSGLDILDEIQQRGILSKTTIIVISGMGFTEVVQQAKEKGAFEFLIKPIDSEVLINRIEKALKRREM